MAIPVNVFAPQVTRIPIGGPSPYNTLVVVSAGHFLAGGSAYGPTHEIFHYPEQVVVTPFILQGAVLASVVLLIELLSGRGATTFVYSNF